MISHGCGESRGKVNLNLECRDSVLGAGWGIRPAVLRFGGRETCCSGVPTPFNLTGGLGVEDE